MTRRIILVLSLVTLAAAGLRLSAAPQVTAEGDRLLAAAKHKAVDDGDLPAAIEMYRRIVTTAGSNRALAASALLGMAECYETLGKPEARETYDLIVREYGSVSTVAAEARAKVAASEQRGPAPPVATSVFDDFRPEAVSPDGKYMTVLSYLKSEGNNMSFLVGHNDVGIRELPSGRIRMLTTKGESTGSYADQPFPSPDGKLIAYLWWDSDTKAFDVRVISKDGGEPRVLYGGEAGWPGLWGWTSDGKSLLACLNKGEGPSRSCDLVLIPSAGGKPRLIKRFEGAGGGGSFMLSPDGRFIAFARRASAAKTEGDVFILSLDAGREESLVNHPADDYNLGWHPSSDRLLFASDRSGTPAIYMVRVANGRSEGEPVLVRSEANRVVPFGFTKSGEFYYGVLSPKREVRIATIDPTTNRLVGNMQLVEGRYSGGMFEAAWSPDGRRLAYIQLTDPRAVVAGNVVPRNITSRLAVHTLATGDVQLVELPFAQFSTPRWSADGRGILLHVNNRRGLARVSAETLAVTQVHESLLGQDLLTWPLITPDGRSVIGHPGSNRPAQAGVGTRGAPISVWALDGTGFQALTSESVGTFELSPDGRWLATTRFTQPDRTVIMIPMAGGAARALGAATPFALPEAPFAWSADSRAIFVVRGGANSAQEVWRVPVDGGAASSTGVQTSGRVFRISAHADGRQLAVSIGENRFETWMLSNLPTVRTK